MPGPRFIVLALWAAWAALALECKAGRGSVHVAADAGSAPAPQGGRLTREQASQVLARVGERTITVADYVAALEHMDQFDRMRYRAPERRQELLNDMIDVMLLADEARERGYDKDPVTEEEIREILRDAMLAKAREGAPTPSAILESDVRAYYDAHRAEYHEPERRRVSAIVLSEESGVAAVLETASKASPSEWGDLVRVRSADSRGRPAVPRDLAGDLGFVSPPGDPRGKNPRIPEEVRAAAFEIAHVGEVLGRPVKAGSLTYIVKLTSKTEPHDRTFEEAARAIRVRLAQDKVREREDALLESLQKEFAVQIDESALDEVRVELPPSDGGRGP